jgi:sucrose phosphorylase
VDFWSEKVTWLITYADHFQGESEPPLRTPDRFIRTQLAGWLTGVHILPFYPWSSGDGFSVTDFTAVDSRCGDWSDGTHS